VLRISSARSFMVCRHCNRVFVRCFRTTGHRSGLGQEEPASGLEPLTCSLRVRDEWLLSVARFCISYISRRVLIPSIFYHHGVLHAG
jgi:hypothetical protein